MLTYEILDVMPMLRWNMANHLGSLRSRPNGRYAPSKVGRNISVIPYLACYTWSHIVATGHKWHSHIRLSVILKSGQCWSQLVTPGQNWSQILPWS